MAASDPQSASLQPVSPAKGLTYGIKEAYLPYLESHGEWLASTLQGAIGEYCAEEANDNASAADLLFKRFGFRPRISQDRVFPNIFESSTLNQRLSALKNGSFVQAKQLPFYYYFLAQHLRQSESPAQPQSLSELLYARDSTGQVYDLIYDEATRQLSVESRPVNADPALPLSGNTFSEQLAPQQSWRYKTVGLGLLMLAIVGTIVIVRLVDKPISNTESIANANSVFDAEFVTLPGGENIALGCLVPDDCNRSNQHIRTVSVQPFAITATEITFEQFDNFCEDTGRQKPQDFGWGRGQRPVIDVSWYDAQAFITWLNQRSSDHYRLPTEIEWEYAARAGSSKRYFWGDVSSEKFANGDEQFEWPDDGYKGISAPVGNYQSNAFGLYDMQGNVAEWVEDCWHSNLNNAPVKSRTAWLDDDMGNCTRRVHRGGGHSGPIATLYNSSRGWKTNDFKHKYIGFRVVKDIPTQ